MDIFWTLTGQKGDWGVHVGMPVGTVHPDQAVRSRLCSIVLLGDDMDSVHNNLSGAATGVSVQAGSIQGGVHLHRASSGMVVPRQLPAIAPDFVGRQTELDRLGALLEASAGTSGTVLITAIDGTAGVGKTALAVRWAYQVLAQFPDGQLYVNLRGFDPTAPPLRPADAVHGFLDALGVPPERIPIDLDAQAAMYRSLVADRRVLIVLDNARDAEQVRLLLPGSSKCVVIVTSRNQLTGLVAHEGARPITVDVLSAEESVELLTIAFGQSRTADESDAVLSLIDQCARLPLALVIVAARAAMNPKLLPRLLVEELRDEFNRLNAFDTGDPVTDLRAVFSWSYRALPSESARLFRLLGLHTAPDISSSATACLGGLPPDRAVAGLAELTRANLLEEHAPGRFKFHDLLRAYAAERALHEESKRHRRLATRRLLDYYLHTSLAADKCLHPHRTSIKATTPSWQILTTPINTYEAAMLWFANEHRTLLAAIVQAMREELYEHAWQLPWSVVNYLDRRGHRYDYIASQETAVAAATRLGDNVALAASLRLLGNAYSRLERHEDGFSCLNRALELYRELGDKLGQAATHYAIGRARERQGNHERALAEAVCALDLFRTTGNNLAWQARALNGLGRSYAFLGNHEEALNHCTEALRLLRSIGDRYNEARTLNSLGYINHQLKAHELSIRNYEESIDVHRALGDHYYEALTFVHLGDVHNTMGNSGAARADWSQALSLFEQQGHPDAEQVRMRLAGGSDKVCDGP